MVGDKEVIKEDGEEEEGEEDNAMKTLLVEAADHMKTKMSIIVNYHQCINNNNILY